MTRYQLVDEFIADTCDSIGATFSVSDFDRWAAERGLDLNAYDALQAHRQAPRKRVFTTERIGMGPLAYYRVVSTSESVDGASVRRMHRQQAAEMVKRWGEEYRNRMGPTAGRSARARRALREAEAQVQAVATLLSVRMDNIDGEE